MKKRNWSAVDQLQAESAKRENVETQERKGDRWTITLPKTRIKTLDQLVAACQVDLSVWEVERFICNKWEVGVTPRAVGSSGDWRRDSTKPIVEPLFQVKAWLVRKKNIVAAKSEIAALKDEAKLMARLFKPARRRVETGKMLELTLPDLHAGRLAWAKETGWENYDVKIAERVFEQSLAALLQRTQGHRFEQVCFVLGNDLLNTDSIEDKTTAGTPVSSDVRFQKTFGVVRRMMVRAIETLRTIAPVRTLLIPGNHDQLSTWHLGDSLECYFARCKDVSIDNAPTVRKYHRFGRVMLMFTHGHRGQHHDYPLLMATEQPEMFGATCWREVHCGHSHKLIVNERHGVRIRALSALCAVDDFLADQTLVGNLRAAEAFVWHKEEGLIGTANYALPTGKDNRVIEK